MVPHRIHAVCLIAEIARENNLPELVDDVNDDILVRVVERDLRVNDASAAVIRHQRINKPVNLFFQFMCHTAPALSIGICFYYNMNPQKSQCGHLAFYE